jgi:hypothetical protein
VGHKKGGFTKKIEDMEVSIYDFYSFIGINREIIYKNLMIPDMEVSINVAIPIAGWLISWKLLLKWMIWGYPHDLGNIHMDKCHENMVFWGFTEIDWRFNGKK